MKKLIKIILLSGSIAMMSPLMATEKNAVSENNKIENSSGIEAITEEVKEEETIPASETNKAIAVKTEEAITSEKKEKGIHQIIKEKISEGGIEFMSIVLICLIIGLIISVERVITLSLSSSNVRKLINQVGTAMKQGGIEAAKESCRKTKGPIAGIFAQGLNRVDEGLDAVEKSIENYGSAEMGKLEKGLTWISLFIALAPMFGFMGTVIGMIDAFDTIQTAEEIQIAQVAGGIKTALLTTVAGLIVAIILQVFYNYIVSKIDSISGQMEDATNDFIDLLVVTKQFK
jgi:biopolymer transport protein ExbB